MCLVMKILEYSSGTFIEPICLQKKKKVNRKKKCNRKRKMVFINGVVRGMTAAEEKLAIVHTPESDCNSNNLDSTASYLSNTSSQDVDFFQDNSDYQWFLDYGYRETHHHASILSLSTSYGVGCYDDLARDIDTQLAEVDMENFRAEDILTTLPAMCCADLQSERQGEMFASVSGSMMVKFDFDSSLSPHSSSQEESNGSSSMSLCKSEPLFSPVRETPLPTTNYSVDSLDCEEQDMMLTCQANKDNYTIAFEGSTVMGDDSDYHDTGDSGATSTWSSEGTGGTRQSSMRIGHLQHQSHMASSDAPFTTWSKLVKRSSEVGLKQQSINNDNVSVLRHSSVSLPNLTARIYWTKNQLNISTMENRAFGLGGCVKLYDVQNNSNSAASESGTSSLSSGTMNVHPAQPQQQPQQQRTQNFSLVRLFIKQRSGSNTSMDQSAASDCNYITSEFDSRRNTKSFSEYEFRETLCDNRKPKTATLKKINSNILSADFRNKNDIKSLTDNNATDWIKDEITAQCFEDSLVQNRSHDLITEEEEDVSDSVERLTESDSTKGGDSVSVCSCEGSLSQSRAKFSVNNNNSFETDDVRIPVQPHLRRGTQTQASQQNSMMSPGSSSTCSDPTDGTRIRCVRGTTVRNSATQCPLHCIDRSMQTSASLQQTPSSNTPTAADDTKKQNGKDKVPDEKKPVYVLYPNYTLPDLEFIKEHQLDLEQVFLTPIRFSPGWTPPTTPTTTSSPTKTKYKPRPVSCFDVEELRKKGFGHIRDWESLTFLLPREYCQLLADIPEIKQHASKRCDNLKPLFCVSPPLSKMKPCEFSPFPDGRTTVNVSSSSSTGTQPSSGYRGSSTLLTDSGPNPSANPLFVYRYDSLSSDSGMTGPPLPKRSISLPEDKNGAPPRPPLPRGILRNSIENAKLRKNNANKKRYSMFEMETTDFEAETELTAVENKRLSYPQCVPGKTVTADSSEGSDEGLGGDSWPRPPTPPTSHALRLQQLLETSGEQWDPKDMDNLRAQVSRFLNQAGRKSVSFADKGEEQQSGMTPPNSPQTSVAHRAYQCKLPSGLCEVPIREDIEASFLAERLKAAEISAKTDLVDVVSDAVDRVLLSYETETMENVAKVTLSTLCPALYAVLSDGLKPTLQTPFGDINNSVWQVIEASAQQGPMTRALNELVLKLNGEDVLTEGVIKFNSFIFGLLNVQGLDVWLSFLRTRESVLRKHYHDDGLILSACRGQANNRVLSDRLLSSLKPLTEKTFKLDLLYETRQLHQSLLQLTKLPISPSHSNSSSSSKGSWTLRRLLQSIQTGLNGSNEEDTTADTTEVSVTRPRSCVDSVGGFSVVSDIASTVRKRWSGTHIGSKLANAFDRLAPDDTEEEYTDSLETGKPQPSHEEECTGKFRRLQMKWEMLSGRDNNTAVQSEEPSPTASPVKSSTNSSVTGGTKSRIPRPVTSPVRPSAQTAPATPASSQRPPIKKPLLPVSQPKKSPAAPSVNSLRNRPMNDITKGRVSTTSGITRTSRLDSLPKTGPVQRPSSLPYRTSSHSRVPDFHRRAVSSSTVRKSDTAANSHNYLLFNLHAS